ncbi:copper resistance protein CopB [Lysobacter daejeonensis GH1-9]|uniref:Copper resistance protein CopB n=1 Tax=Lysobacter daejeonensis GH1-9 TaxID=1385517 RepID=A0A0A0EZ96_9GAMM|nr:copper resistance protein B [Lysobacter daejeonensis]KGM56276.1 copper resistance protein CopB [Lysobacter daejeonensis GH1-9]
MNRSPALALLALSVAMQLSGAALAQDHSGHQGHTTPQSSQEDQHAAHAGHAKSSEASDSSAPITPIPELNDADRAAAFPDLHKHMEHAPAFNWYVGINRLEGWDADGGTGQAWEATAWFGTDLNRLWLRSEGERLGGHTESADIEVLYGRSVSAWWDVVGGVRQETRPGPSRSWAALGVQGLAPYKFEVQATAYVGDGGRVEANVEAEYELLLTNRLILQPLVEVDFAAKDDEARGVGSGLSKAEAGLRLRYEFTRRFAPYVGVVHERAFGSTADLRKAEGEPVTDTRLVVGLRTWF